MWVDPGWQSNTDPAIHHSPLPWGSEKTRGKWKNLWMEVMTVEQGKQDLCIASRRWNSMLPIEKKIQTGKKNMLYKFLVLELHKQLKLIMLWMYHIITILQNIDVYMFLQIGVFGYQHVCNGQVHAQTLVWPWMFSRGLLHSVL